MSCSREVETDSGLRESFFRIPETIVFHHQRVLKNKLIATDP